MSESIVPLKISSVDKLTEYWIAEGERQATERIIKLLEQTEDDWRCREGCCDCLGWDFDNPINQLGHLIALIKGEK